MILDIKEMVYQDKWFPLDEAEVLEKNFFKGYEYFIKNRGYYPSAYIALREGQPFYKARLYEDVDVNCHGNCVYVVREADKTTIGWDYNKLSDYHGGTSYVQRLLTKESAKVWTTEEIVEECKQVIEQLYLREHPELYYK